MTRGGNKTIDKGDAIRERPHGKHFFSGLNDLVGCGHMSGLFLRSIYPLALMKSDGRDPYQQCELSARERQRVVPGLR